MRKVELPAGYSFREMSKEEFQPLWQEQAARIFDDDALLFRVFPSLSAGEQDRWRALGRKMGEPYTLRLGIFHGEEFVGWHVGDQKDAQTFYMRNSAVLPAHRRLGLYTALLSEVMGRVEGEGFQLITSRHVATNNDVIIPKLKAGFLLTGMELSDSFGTLVHLTYFTNPLRRKVMDFRAGQVRPDEDLRQAFRL